MGWHEERFTARPGVVEKACRTCGRKMWLPKSKANEYHTCGGECAKAARKAPIDARTRPCETCGAAFTPRQVQITRGGGRFCSQKCNTAGRAAMLAPEVAARSAQTMADMRARGEVRYLRGPDNPCWTGGKEASSARRIPKQVEWTREYRKRNPHMAREWAQNRRNKKHGRLPYGTIPKLGEMQHWRCAICRGGIKNGYHVDHIMPIAKGGKHEPRNLQLLCGPCNVRKWAKNPIDYMQQIGRLL